MIIYPDNNLGPRSQEWADKIEGEIRKLDRKASVAGAVGPAGPQGPKGERGPSGEIAGQIDGGYPFSIYGGIAPIDAGTI